MQLTRYSILNEKSEILHSAISIKDVAGANDTSKQRITISSISVAVSHFAIIQSLALKNLDMEEIEISVKSENFEKPKSEAPPKSK